MQERPLATWVALTQQHLHAGHPFAAHQILCRHVFADWDAHTHGPHPITAPSAAAALVTNAAQFMNRHADLLGSEEPEAAPGAAATWAALGLSPVLIQLMRRWELLHAASVNKREEFWPRFLETIGFQFATPPSRVLSLSQDGNPDRCRWFPGATLNIAACALHGPQHNAAACAMVAASERDPTRCAPPPTIRHTNDDGPHQRRWIANSVPWHATAVPCCCRTPARCAPMHKTLTRGQARTQAGEVDVR